MTKRIEQLEELTRQAVPEVFQVMLSMELTAEAPSSAPLAPVGEIIGSVGFTGEATGIVCLYASLAFAKVITSRMLGMELAEVAADEMVNDAFGELSNMVVGHVKSRLCDAGLRCILTIPSIVRGEHLKVEGPSQVGRKVIGFRNHEHCLWAEVLVKEQSGQKL
jgi:chemotaxis protein CheX